MMPHAQGHQSRSVLKGQDVGWECRQRPLNREVEISVPYVVLCNHNCNKVKGMLFLQLESSKNLRPYSSFGYQY